jgi:hypothetical protein
VSGETFEGNVSSHRMTNNALFDFFFLHVLVTSPVVLGLNQGLSHAKRVLE